ncbi:replication factor rfc1 c terminal domain containing protein [Acanthamoeba castellanii str. Neff]|uniref:Replication factor C subunit 1 n=1 Tax=Acanthamoeba castellanii (strain ATCC 30010 / Neff) TaxID=1257118 RepID=L8HIF4_ACACF|nr:replication factor rfc1 c terminal domain containing protein [Acanthamoeba castellanii str. Neff]ELR24992.1 replication factor rfc1 c terminal domain containing protein [Acanthamoeba castellanii str. Neff]
MTTIFEAPVKKGVKRGREPAAKKETTTATKAREPPAKKVKKAAEELPWPDIVQEGTEDEPTPKAKAKTKASAASTRPTLRAKRRPTEAVKEEEEEEVEAQPKRSTPTKKKAKKAHTKQQEEVAAADDIPWDDDVEDVDDIPWDQPTTTATTPTKKAATARTTRGETPGESPGKKSKAAAAAAKPEPKSPVKKVKPSEAKSPAKSPAKSTTTTVIERKTPVVEKKVVEAKPAPAKRGGGGGGYPFWMQNRAGPPHLGMKDLPEGKPWCLWGKVFMCTGVLDSLERDDCFTLIEHYGGTVAKSVTKKLTHAVVGTDAGAKKLEQIEARKAQGLVALDEDGLFDLIRNSPEHRPSAAEIAKFNKQRKTEGAPAKPKALQTAAPLLPSPTPASAEEEQKKGPELWVEKYKPKSTKEVIANPAAVKKLQDWLQGWQRSEVQRAKRGEAPARGATQKNAALLSGPPGIGKTTTAHLVAAECGYYALEFNASDTRSKKMIKEHLAQSTENRGLAEFFTGRGGEDGKTVLIMDEVDGMSSGDRGGMAEIIALIKKTHIPIICLCNDRASAKVRSLANYCLDIQLQKPTTQQILGRVTQILQRENIAIDNATLTRIVDASNGDVRQLLNMLQMLTVKSKDLGTLSAPELQERLRTSLKEVELGPLDAVNKLFNATEYQKLSLDAKLDLYFIDPSFVPLFIQENYLHCRPRRARNVSRNPEVERLVEMDLISQAADSFSEADLFDVAIHRDQDWSLAPIHGVFSAIRPAEFMTGNLAGRIDFPKWLGKFSSRKKRFRLLTELAVRMSATTSGDKALLRLDYLPHLVRPLTAPLAKKGADGIDEVLALMDAYGITREDWDTVLELMELGDKDWAKSIPTNVKTAFTRKYKAAHLAVKSAPARKGTVNYVLPEEAAAQGRDGDDEGDDAFNDDEAGEGEGDEGDSMIVARASKKGAAKGAKGGAKKPAARGGAAGRGRGRGETAKAKAK